MIGADAALAALIDRAYFARENSPPAYVTFTETLHVAAAGRAKDINRFEAVRVADGFAVMHDLPNGGTNKDYAFPVTPFFDPFSSFAWAYQVNLAKVYVKVVPAQLYYFNIPQSSTADAIVPFFPYWYPRYAPDSTDAAPHIVIDRTSLWPKDAFYVSDVVEDPATQLPSSVTLREDAENITVGLTYAMVDNYWMVTKATFSKTEHLIFGTISGSAEMDYSGFQFPTTAPDPALAGTPIPSPSPAPSASS